MADPAYQEPGDFVPLNEVTIRTENALKTQKRIQRLIPRAKDFRLNNVHLACILCSAPLSAFEGGDILSDRLPVTVMHEYLEALPSLIKHCEDLYPFTHQYSEKRN